MIGLLYREERGGEGTGGKGGGGEGTRGKGGEGRRGMKGVGHYRVWRVDSQY